MMYYVNWVLTTAQLELLASDVSVVDYDYKKERKKGDFDDTPADEAAVRRANEEWKERYGDGENAGANISIGDLFGSGIKADVGIKVGE